MKSKLLVRINKLREIKEYQKEGINNFLFPLINFSVGYNSFTLDELKDLDVNVYLLVNRIFDNKACDEFKKLKDSLVNIKGIIFEDIAVYQILKNSNIDLIWNQNHFAVNYHSINYWLNKDNITSAVISNELEKNELINVINNVNKKIVLPIFGLNMAMYSRRYLLSYYVETFNKQKINKAILKNGDIEFLAVENEYGTVLFYNKYFNLLNEIDKFNDDNILFYYIDPNELDTITVMDILNGKKINYDNRFYENKTVFKVGDLK